MGQIVTLRSEQAEKDVTSFLGMVMFLASWVMLFGGLFLVYALLRVRQHAWPPPGSPTVPLALSALNTLVIAASSGTMHRALASIRRGEAPSLTRWLGATLLLGFAFLALQSALWRGILDLGLRVDTNLYGSVFWALSVFHALHVLSGIAVLGWLLRGALGGRYHAARHAPVRVGAMFWHFVGAVWVVLWLTTVVV